MKLTTLTKPADFPLVVKTYALDGSEVTVTFTGIGRTLRDWMPIALKRLEADANERLELEEKRQDLLAAPTQEAEPVKSKKARRIKLDAADAVKAQEEALDKAVAKLREVAAGWDLEDEFTDANLKELVIRFPGIQGDAWTQYDERIKGHRVKN